MMIKRMLTPLLLAASALLVGCGGTAPKRNMAAYEAANPRSIVVVPVVNKSLDVDASNYVRTIEKRTEMKIGAPEEVAWRRGFLTDDELRARAEPLLKSGYGSYLLGLLERPTA